MKANKIKLNIPQPCHQDWSKMTPQEKGSFCVSCTKLVVDFTTMTDREVIDYLAKAQGQQTCGRFTKFQIGRELLASSPQPSIYRQFKNYVVGVLVSLGLPSLLKAEKTLVKSSIDIHAEGQADKLSDQITGKVVNQHGAPVAFAQVLLLKNGETIETGVFSKANGEFVIQVIEGVVWNNLRLELTALGYQKVQVGINQSEDLIITLSKDNEEELSRHMLGEVLLEDLNPTKEEILIPKEVEGKVTDAYGEPLTAATVTVLESEISVKSDDNGKFSISLSTAISARNELKLRISATGYNTQVINLNSTNQDQYLQIKLHSIEQMIMGIFIQEPIIKTVSTLGVEESK